MKITDYERHKIDAILNYVFLNEDTDILPVIPLNSFYTHLGPRRWELKGEFFNRFSSGEICGLYYNDDRIAVNTIKGHLLEDGSELVIKFILQNVNITKIMDLKND